MQRMVSRDTLHFSHNADMLRPTTSQCFCKLFVSRPQMSLASSLMPWLSDCVIMQRVELMQHQLSHRAGGEFVTGFHDFGPGSMMKRALLPFGFFIKAASVSCSGARSSSSFTVGITMSFGSTSTIQLSRRGRSWGRVRFGGCLLSWRGCLRAHSSGDQGWSSGRGWFCRAGRRLLL